MGLSVFDPASDHLYVSNGTELTVVDVISGKIIGHVTGLEGSHGITIDPKTRLGYADSSVTRTISIFDPDSFQIVKTMPALEDADGEVFDTFSNQVFVTGGDANAVLGVNPAKLEKTKLILVTADVLSMGPAPAPGRAPTIHFKPGTLKLLMYQLAK